MAIIFYSNTSFHVKQKRLIKTWVKHVCTLYGKKTGDINYIFQSDEELLELNKTHLNHDYYTDIITFNYSENKIIHGDLNISIDRVKDNAIKFEVPFEEEILRVMIHGILHLLGQNDKTKKESREMKKMEDECLRIYKQIVSREI